MTIVLSAEGKFILKAANKDEASKKIENTINKIPEYIEPIIHNGVVFIEANNIPHAKHMFKTNFHPILKQNGQYKII
jgi:hypothetical protein